MDIIHSQKYLRMSPTKVRFVVAMIKKMTPIKAIDTLPFIGRKASEPLAKTIKGAVAQAKERGFSESELTFKEIQITEGPRLKRGTQVSRGRWHPIVKKMCHIRVVLNAQKEVAKTKEKTKETSGEGLEKREIKENTPSEKKIVKKTVKKGETQHGTKS